MLQQPLASPFDRARCTVMQSMCQFERARSNIQQPRSVPRTHTATRHPLLPAPLILMTHDRPHHELRTHILIFTSDTEARIKPPPNRRELPSSASRLHPHHAAAFSPVAFPSEQIGVPRGRQNRGGTATAIVAAAGEQAHTSTNTSRLLSSSFTARPSCPRNSAAVIDPWPGSRLCSNARRASVSVSFAGVDVPVRRRAAAHTPLSGL